MSVTSRDGARFTSVMRDALHKLAVDALAVKIALDTHAMLLNMAPVRYPHTTPGIEYLLYSSQSTRRSLGKWVVRAAVMAADSLDLSTLNSQATRD